MVINRTIKLGNRVGEKRPTVSGYGLGLCCSVTTVPRITSNDSLQSKDSYNNYNPNTCMKKSQPPRSSRVACMMIFIAEYLKRIIVVLLCSGQRLCKPLY